MARDWVIITPHACARGKVITLCTCTKGEVIGSVVIVVVAVVIVVILDTKIAKS